MPKVLLSLGVILNANLVMALNEFREIYESVF